MNREEWVEQEVAKRGEMPAHNRSTLRSMLKREWEWWEGEEDRVLKDSNRFRDDN